MLELVYCFITASIGKGYPIQPQKDAGQQAAYQQEPWEITECWCGLLHLRALMIAVAGGTKKSGLKLSHNA
jgi:hypothetical protein